MYSRNLIRHGTSDGIIQSRRSNGQKIDLKVSARQSALLHFGQVSVPGQQRFDLLDRVCSSDVREHMVKILVRLQPVGLGGLDQTVSGGTGSRPT